MDTGTCIYWIGICAIILIAGCNLTTASDLGGQNNFSLLAGNISENRFSPDYGEYKTDSVNALYEELRTGVQTGDLKTGPTIMNMGDGWQNITIPASISSPGKYRVVNNYTAIIEEVGLSITCSDVIIDGAGHVFRGNDEYNTYGLLTYAPDTPLSNVSVSNYYTENCLAGIAFFNVQGGEISHTHHTDSTDGIFIGTTDSVNISHNIISGYKINEIGDGIFGIVGMDVKDTHIESNTISNITPILQNIKSYGIILTNCTESEVIDNYLADSRTGLTAKKSESLNISGNSIAGYGNEESGEEIIGILGTDSKNVRITSNTITPADSSDLSSFSGIVLTQCSDFEILKNTLSGLSRGIVIDRSLSVITSHNTVTNIGTDIPDGTFLGILGMDSIDTLIQSNHIITSGPRIPFTQISGISLINCSESGILGNYVTGQKDIGIAFETNRDEISKQLELIDNRINAADTGIFINNGVGIIGNNSVEDCTHGMLLTMDDSNVSYNQVSHSLQTGIGIFGENLTLSHNHMTNNSFNFYVGGDTIEQYLHHIDRTNIANGRPIIYIRDSCGDTIGPADNPAMVMVVNSRDVTIHNVTTGSNAFGVILANVTGATISDATDTRALGGFTSLWSNNITMSNLSASQNQGFGYTVQGSGDVSLNQCSASELSGSGFIVQNSANTSLNTCVADDFLPGGIELEKIGIVSRSSTSVRIQNSVISESQQSGMMAWETDGFFVNNTFITNNSAHGISCISSTGVSVNNSIIAGNQESGISLENSTITAINRNGILGNHVSGMSLYEVYDGVIADNIFNNTQNVEFVDESSHILWNTPLMNGHNIIDGAHLGGNFWAEPKGEGFSQTHADRGDGICNGSYMLNSDNVDYLPLALPSEDIIADFVADKHFGTPPVAVNFTDTSSGSLVYWNWTFGDGTLSYEQNPVHTYSGIGTYSVTLEVTSQDGKQGIIRKPALIDVNSGRVTGQNGMVWVTSSPSNSSVFLDEIFIGLTPLKVSGIRAGLHQLMVTQDGYQNWKGMVKVLTNQYTYVPKVILKAE